MSGSIRLSVKRSARLVLLVSVVVFAVVVTLVRVEPPASFACPIEISKPLRALYTESELVAVARVGDSVKVEQKHPLMGLTRTVLHVSSLLKGESKEVREKVVNLYHYVWGAQNADSPNTYSKDDVLLVFLRTREGGDGYVPTDYERGVKKLPPDDLKVYVSRIEELSVIMRDVKPSAEVITEWLVRCAEEPATRWEGAFELGVNAPQLQDPPQEGEEAETDAGETEGASEETPGNAGEEKEDENGSDDGQDAPAAAGEGATGAGNVKNETADATEVDVVSISTSEASLGFVPFLTPAQKERLLTALVGAEELNEGEQMLLRLVGIWKDERLVPFLLKHLSRVADKSPYEAEDMMRIVAHTLGDGTLIKFVASYSKTASYDDIYNEYANVVDGEDSNASAGERAALKKSREEVKAAAAEALFQRSGKLRHFLALAVQPQTP
ncbi:MAG TPA: hypothetical protein VK363_05170 [Pyrinomonadaceae bacterium]|nr:hypothetical protein [Pyrinomonadaceae bacterium]